MRNLLFCVLSAFPLLGQTIQRYEVYELSQMTGQQVVYASHIKPEALKDPKKIDSEDRAALLGAIGKTGIAMPRLKQPVVENDATMSPAKLTIITAKMDNGEVSTVARLEYKDGKDDLVVFDEPDTITCMLMGEGVMQVYTIHRNVTFPEGEKLVTCITTRNRPLGVTSMSLSGKAKRVK